MKKFLFALSLICIVPATSAETFVKNGILMGTVCRFDDFTTHYSKSLALPVGSICKVKTKDGVLIGLGQITHE